MTHRAQKIDAALRIACAIACSFAAVLFFLIFAALCAVGFRHHLFGTRELGLPIALAIIGLLTFFCVHISWKLWRGSLSLNGVTFMPTWFIQMFGVFFLVGIAFVIYHNPSYPLVVEGISIALAMIFFGRYLAKRKREIEHKS